MQPTCLLPRMALLFCVAGSALAGTPRFVANNGNDQNPGTMAAPWATLARAGRARGATVLLKRGDVFRESADLGQKCHTEQSDQRLPNPNALTG